MNKDFPPKTGKYSLRVAAIVLFGAAALVGVHFLDPIPQDQSYYDLADRRVVWNIPYFGDVVTNIAYLLPGLLGLGWLFGSEGGRRQGAFINPQESRAYNIFFAGVLLTAFGSGWFHLDPKNETLLWDRLPMTLGFMGLFSAVISERINSRYGITLLPLFVVAGVASVVHWHFSELAGEGDLRYYGLVQFFPLAAIPVMMFIFPARYTRSGYIWGAFAWYMLAKVTEFLDHEIYEATFNVVSGHNIKHIFSAISGICIYLMLKKRHILPGSLNNGCDSPKSVKTNPNGE